MMPSRSATRVDTEIDHFLDDLESRHGQRFREIRTFVRICLAMNATASLGEANLMLKVRGPGKPSTHDESFFGISNSGCVWTSKFISRIGTDSSGVSKLVPWGLDDAIWRRYLGDMTAACPLFDPSGYSQNDGARHVSVAQVGTVELLLMLEVIGTLLQSCKQGLTAASASTSAPRPPTT